jgi:hypothetical protein
MIDEPNDKSAPKPGGQQHEKSPEEIAKEVAAKRRDEILQRVMKGKKNQQQQFHQHKGAHGTPKFSPSPIRRGPRGG